MRALLLSLCVLWPGLAWPQSAADFEQALRLPELAAILAEESGRTAAQINEEMLMGEGGRVFAAQIEQINDPARLASEIADGLVEALSDEDAAAIYAFLVSDQGQRAIGLELSARQAFLDPDIEEFARAEADSSPYAAQIDRLLDAGDMIVQNRETTELTTSAFYLGLRAGGAIELSDAEIRDLAIEQAAGTDEDTRGWLTGFFTLAYSPLEPYEMDVLVAFWETEQGVAFSDALFDVFDAAYTDRWYAMGRAAALFMVAEEL